LWSFLVAFGWEGGGGLQEKINSNSRVDSFWML